MMRQAPRLLRALQQTGKSYVIYSNISYYIIGQEFWQLLEGSVWGHSVIVSASRKTLWPWSC